MEGDTMAQTTILASGAAEMVAAGQEQITEIQQVIDRLDEQIAEANEQITDIADNHEARGTAIKRERVECDRVAQLHLQAQGYAKIAHGLPHEQPAIKAA